MRLLNSIIFLFLNDVDSIPTRLNVGIMSFLICFVAYILRANISINILAMKIPANKTNLLNGNESYRPDAPDVSGLVFKYLLFLQ